MNTDNTENYPIAVIRHLELTLGYNPVTIAKAYDLNVVTANFLRITARTLGIFMTPLVPAAVIFFMVKDSVAVLWAGLYSSLPVALFTACFIGFRVVMDRCVAEESAKNREVERRTAEARVIVGYLDAFVERFGGNFKTFSFLDIQTAMGDHLRNCGRGLNKLFKDEPFSEKFFKHLVDMRELYNCLRGIHVITTNEPSRFFLPASM